MKFQTAMACLVVAVAAPIAGASAADPATKPTAEAAGKGLHESRTVEKKATITAIDTAKRIATLKTADGNEFELEVGPEVTNFNTLKVGDMVVATYAQSLGVRIEPAGQASPGVKETATATPAPGQAKVGREVTATLKVESVDVENNMVTLSDGAGHSAPVDVVDPRARERLKTLKPGEMVVITYTEALALRLEKVAAK
jgi:hypothetical protein